MHGVELVRLGKAHAEEAAGDPVPEMRAAALVDDAAQFGERPVGEAVAVKLDEKVAAPGEQHAQPAGALGRVEEEAAHFRAALEIGAQCQHLVAEGLAERLRCLGDRADPIGIEGAFIADLGEDLAGAADLAGLDIFEHHQEHVVLPLGRLGGEGLFGADQFLDQRAAIGGQVGEAAAG